MRIDTKIGGYTAWIDVAEHNGTYRVTVPDLRLGPPTSELGWNSARFPNIVAAEAAVRKYDLALRKGFLNPVAYLHNGRRGIEEVVVTSIVPNASPNASHPEAWIRRADGRREKVDQSRLFADAAEVEQIADQERQVELRWEKAARWKPLFDRDDMSGARDGEPANGQGAQGEAIEGGV